MSVLTSFEKWKAFLGEQVTQAHQSGLNDETMTRIATSIGTFLAQHVEPQNAEERMLKQLWDVSNDNERKMLAKLMLKLVD